MIYMKFNVLWSFKKVYILFLLFMFKYYLFVF